MYKQIIGLTLLALASVSYARVNGWVDCGSSAVIREVRAGTCTQTPCQFQRNNTYIIELDATSTEVASSLPFLVNATILGLPWTILEGNACDTVACPTTVGQLIYWSYSYFVSEIFPPVPTTATVQVLNQAGAINICFSLAIQIL